MPASPPASATSFITIGTEEHWVNINKVAYERTMLFTTYATVGIIIATLVVDIKEIGLTKNKS